MVDETDLTRIFEISGKRAAAFGAVGICSCAELAECDPATVATDLRALGGVNLSAVQLEQMRYHARSYREERAILFGPPPHPGDAFIALDLEYNPFRPHVWLIGLYVVERGRSEHIVLWADSPRWERKNLRRLAALLEELDGLPILTWAGRSADLPELKKACARLGLGDLVAGLGDRHVDLFDHARRALRLPIPQLGLGEVAAFFGMAKGSEIDNGLEAQMLYDNYRAEDLRWKRAELKRELIAYNRDDLEAVVETLRAVERLPVEGPAAHSAELLPGVMGAAGIEPATSPV